MLRQALLAAAVSVLAASCALAGEQIAGERTVSGVIRFDEAIDLPAGATLVVYISDSSSQHAIYSRETAPISSSSKAWQFSMPLDTALANESLIAVNAWVGFDNQCYFDGRVLDRVERLTSAPITIVMKYVGSPGEPR